MRKSVLIFVIAMATFSLHAQTEQTYTQMFDSLFNNVSYSTAISGVVYDRVICFSNIRQTTDTCSYSRFIQAYSELNRAVVNPSVNQKFSLVTEGLKENLKNISYIPIGIINAQYDIIDTNALHSGKLYESDGLYYVNNAIHGNLFVQKQAILASPLIKWAGSVVRFGLNSLFIFENYATTVSTISIDFDNQTGLHNYTIGDTNIMIEYPTEGLKKLTIQLHLSNGTTVTTYARLQIVFPKPPVTQKSNNCFDTSNYANPRITAQIAYGGIYGKADVRYYRQPGKQYLEKPIVIVTGFDPNSAEKFTKAYERMQYGGTVYVNTEQNLMNKLYCDLGYDIVIVKFPIYNAGAQRICGGTDYIQRNAFTVIEVINQINQELSDNGSQEQIVIIGPSMGGQITRYALRYMENNPNDPKTNWGNHNCRLWISFDSPHVGANAPYGGQAFFDYFGRWAQTEIVKQRADEILNTPAALQMLQLHIYDPNRTWQAKYYREIDSLGYPNQLRKIAVTNGSLNATPTGYDHQLTVKIQSSALNASIRNITGGGDNQHNDHVFYGFHVGPGGRGTTYHKRFGTPCGNDAQPGGTFDFYRQIYTEMMAELRNSGKVDVHDSYCYLNSPTHCFMPTYSTLGYWDGWQDGCQDLWQGGNRDLVAEGKTPFDSYTGPINKNMEHVSYDAAIADYVRKEIETYIEGTRELEACGNFTYSVHLPEDADPNTTITWLCSSNLTIIPSNSPTRVCVYTTSTGDAWISAEVSSLERSHRLANYPITINAPTHNIFLQYPSITNTTIESGNSETWSETMALPHIFTIEQGKTLTITSNIYCNASAKIIVRPGGKLIIDGGTLTNACDDELWRGIEIHGDPNNLYQDMTNQGFVELKNGAVIKNAQTGILVGSSTPSENLGGGILKAYNSTFINCAIGVEFKPFARIYNNRELINRSYFENCEFVWDHDLIEQHVSVLPYTHVKLAGVGKVTFAGCSFRNTNMLQSNVTQGIYAHNAGVNVKAIMRNVGNIAEAEVVKRSTFENLTYGIYYGKSATSMITGLSTPIIHEYLKPYKLLPFSFYRALSVVHSDFNGNVQGIFNTNANNSVIRNNNFNLICPYGIPIPDGTSTPHDEIALKSLEQSTLSGISEPIYNHAFGVGRLATSLQHVL